MLRDSMVTLVTRVRGLIGDSSGTVFDDDSVQDALDQHGREVRYALLDAQASIAPGGGVTYKIFDAGVGNWEEDAELVDGSFDGLTPAVSDWLRGRWTFAEGQALPVRITGRYYDLFGAAADLLERWSALSVSDGSAQDWQEGDVSEKGSQTLSQRLSLAQEYRAKQWPQTVCMTRSDTQ